MHHIRTYGKPHDAVGHTKAKIIVKMHLERLVNPALDGVNQIWDRMRSQPAHRVHDCKRVHMSICGNLPNQLEHPVNIGTCHINWEKHRVQPGSLSGFCRLDRQLNRLFQAPAVCFPDHFLV